MSLPDIPSGPDFGLGNLRSKDGHKKREKTTSEEAVKKVSQDSTDEQQETTVKQSPDMEGLGRDGQRERPTRQSKL